MGLPDEQQNMFRKKCHQVSEYHKFQGEWLEIEELLQLQNNAPGRIISFYLERHSSDAWFGTDLPRIIRIIRSGKTYNPYLPKKGKVNTPQRKRGYNDKGSLSSTDKLTLQHWITPRDRTELPDISKTPFYPEWYVRDKNSTQEGLRTNLAFPPQEGDEDYD